MEPVRQLFGILVVATTILVILRIVTTDLIVRAVRNPFIVIIMGFLLTTLGWLAWIGLILLFHGYSILYLSGTTLGILALLILIFMAAMFHPRTAGKFFMFFLIGAWIFLIGILAVMGLGAITAEYVEQNVITWVFISLGVALALQIMLRYLGGILRPPQ